MNLVNQDLKKREEEVDAWTTWDTKLIIKIKIKMHEDPRTKMHGLKCALYVDFEWRAACIKNFGQVFRWASLNGN